jgi:hypothetical protein
MSDLQQRQGSPYLKIQELRKYLTEHPMYRQLDRVAHIRRFMEAHVFAVWDFMSLLKALQRELTCVEVPWVCRNDAQMMHLINEIVLGEESDSDGEGGHISHFELYLQAMDECGASRARIDGFIADLKTGVQWEAALTKAGVPPHVEAFVRNTLSVALSGAVHRVAAAFFYGREDVIPDMFRAMIAAMESHAGGTPPRLRYYLDRHIEVDGDSHGPLARRMMMKLCGDDRVRHREAVETAISVLNSRIALWDGVAAGFRQDARKSAGA